MMVYTVTGKASSKVMFNRKLMCHLDINRPKKKDETKKLYDCTKYFNVSERVACRSYLGKVKWMYGIVKKRLHYFRSNAISKN